MTSRRVFRAVSLVVAAFGILVLVATGRLAVALGAVAGPEPGIAFWYQLSFMRMFAVALIGLASLGLWGAAQLTPIQQRSLGRVLGGVFAALALMAVAQSVAIWGGVTGWGVTAVLGLAAVMYGLSAAGRVGRPAV